MDEEREREKEINSLGFNPDHYGVSLLNAHQRRVLERVKMNQLWMREKVTGWGGRSRWERDGGEERRKELLPECREYTVTSNEEWLTYRDILIPI